MRSSTKKKMINDGINWNEVAEEAKPRVLFSQGVNKTPSTVKSLGTTSFSTPLSQVLLDITITSAEKKFLDSPSRGKETSPVTEALFNTTILSKKSFPSDYNDKESGESIEKDFNQKEFMERYMQLRNNILNGKITEKLTSNNKEEPEIHEQNEGFQEQAICSTSNKSDSSPKFIKQNTIIEGENSYNIKSFVEDKTKKGKILSKINTFSKQKLLNEHSLRREPLEEDNIKYTSLQVNEDVESLKESDEELFGDELQNNQVSLQSEKFISDIASSQSKDDILKCNQIEQNEEQNQSTSNPEQKTVWSELKLTEIIGNYYTFKEDEDFKKETHTDNSEEEESNYEEDGAYIEDENQIEKNTEKPNKKKKSQSMNLQDDAEETSNADLGMNSVSLRGTDEIIDIATDDEDNKLSTEDETDELLESESTEDEEDLEEEISEEENDSDESENEGTLQDISSNSSDQGKYTFYVFFLYCIL